MASVKTIQVTGLFIDDALVEVAARQAREERTAASEKGDSSLPRAILLVNELAKNRVMSIG